MHITSTFWSLIEDFINEYGSKFLDNKSFIVDWLISEENIHARTYIPSGMVCDRANQEHVNLTHTQAVYSTQWRTHNISLFTFTL